MCIRKVDDAIRNVEYSLTWQCERTAACCVSARCNNPCTSRKNLASFEEHEEDELWLFWKISVASDDIPQSRLRKPSTVKGRQVSAWHCD